MKVEQRHQRECSEKETKVTVMVSIEKTLQLKLQSSSFYLLYFYLYYSQVKHIPM